MAQARRQLRRSMVLALLATTALATALGGCNQTGMFSRLQRAQACGR